VALTKTGQKSLIAIERIMNENAYFLFLDVLRLGKYFKKDILTQACHVSEGFRALFWILERGPLCYHPVTTK